ncbi:hypothetical protein SUGI_0993590 [Cryptomeria japonica]|nr:hypothetical protein SUGI_0993590 [Cryptomeria japonica]
MLHFCMLSTKPNYFPFLFWVWFAGSAGVSCTQARNTKQVGTLAEFTVAEEHLLALKPTNLSFEEAVSLTLAILTALQAFDTIDFQKGQSVFIVGGAGYVGTLAIQLAKHVFEASRIVSTCSAGKEEFVKILDCHLLGFWILIIAEGFSGYIALKSFNLVKNLRYRKNGFVFLSLFMF